MEVYDNLYELGRPAKNEATFRAYQILVSEKPETSLYVRNCVTACWSLFDLHENSVAAVR